MKKVRYSVSGNRTTWYAFFQETPDALTIVYLANNHLMGHHMD